MKKVNEKVKATRMNIDLTAPINTALLEKAEKQSTPNCKASKKKIVEQYVIAGLQRDGYSI